jgi:hypothetical protein
MTSNAKLAEQLEEYLEAAKPPILCEECYCDLPPDGVCTTSTEHRFGNNRYISHVEKCGWKFEKPFISEVLLQAVADRLNAIDEPNVCGGCAAILDSSGECWCY